MIIVHAYAYVYAKPEHREAYLDGLRALRHSTLELDTGCLRYAFWEDIDQPGRFVCVEEWTDMASLNAHLEAPHHIAGSAALDPLRARPAQIDVFEAESIDL